jgi:GNAT superfamily N-acetyltransferase
MSRTIKMKSENRRCCQGFARYHAIESPPVPSDEFLDLIGCDRTNHNDIIDAHILYALNENCVAILVTEDNGIHSKARRCGLEEKVYTISEGVELLKELYERLSVAIPHIDDVPVHSLNKSDTIFDSLKSDYPRVNDSPSFVEWFESIKQEGRHAFVNFNQDKSLGGVCIYKDKSEGGQNRVLKICTFKVSENARGRKIGELLIKTVFNYCIRSSYRSAFVTVFPKYERLIDLFRDFGFVVRDGPNGQR